jgi:hypothetical protein
MEYNLIWAEKKEDGSYDLTNPRNLMGMNLDKAIGSLKWSRSLFGKDFPCFIYDPSVVSIFNDDETQNIEMIQDLLNNSNKIRKYK